MLQVLFSYVFIVLVAVTFAILPSVGNAALGMVDSLAMLLS